MAIDFRGDAFKNYDGICGLKIKNYRSFEEATLRLGKFTALVGPNGAGKSTVVDAFRFVAESLTLSLYTALERRGGIQAVRYRSASNRPRNFQLGLDLAGDEPETGAHYEFALSAQPAGAYVVREETCVATGTDGTTAKLRLKRGEVLEYPRYVFRIDDEAEEIELPQGTPKAIDPTVLGLPVLSAFPPFSNVLDTLRGLRWYSIVPDKLRELQEPDEGAVLLPDGSNATSVLRRLGEPDREELIAMLGHVVPGVIDVRTVSRGTKLTLQFTQKAQLGRNKFEAHQMSDGTLRILGMLLGLYQPEASRFVAFEEPEATVHPAALEAMIAVFRSRAAQSQILLTTHSADIIDFLDIGDIRLVSAEDGTATIREVSEHSKQVIRDALFTPGELLRTGGLRAEGADVATAV